MAVNIKSISTKLKQARELQSLSLESVALETGIEISRLTSIEKEDQRPSGDEVLILANYYRHDFRDFLDDTRGEPFEKTDILYRRHGNSFTGQDRRSIQEFLFLCELEEMLEQAIGIRKINFSITPRGDSYKKHGEQAALKLREVFAYTSREIPMDVFADFRRIGIHIFRRRLSNPEISGLYIEHPVAGHCVLINYDEDIYRQRFSVSHEVAHAIFDSSDSVAVSYRPNAVAYDKSDQRERRANRFAACYLMPPDLLPNESVWDQDAALRWAKKLKVSTTALSYALLDAKRINLAQTKIIQSVRVPRSEKIDPEAPENLSDTQQARRIQLLERGLSDYYVNLCFEAHQRKIISAGRLAEALLADHGETQEISHLYGRAMTYGI